MRLIIDRFEGSFAVCEDDKRNMVNIERNKLSPEVKEGDVLNVDDNIIKVDAKETHSRRDKVKKLTDGLWE